MCHYLHVGGDPPPVNIERKTDTICIILCDQSITPHAQRQLVTIKHLLLKRLHSTAEFNSIATPHITISIIPLMYPSSLISII